MTMWKEKFQWLRVDPIGHSVDVLINGICADSKSEVVSSSRCAASSASLAAGDEMFELLLEVHAEKIGDTASRDYGLRLLNFVWKLELPLPLWDARCSQDQFEPRPRHWTRPVRLTPGLGCIERLEVAETDPRLHART